MNTENKRTLWPKAALSSMLIRLWVLSALAVSLAPSVHAAGDSCSSTLSAVSGGYALNVPVLTFNTVKWKADFAYVPTSDGNIWFKVIAASPIAEPSPYAYCFTASLTSDFFLHIPELIFGAASYSVDTQYIAGGDTGHSADIMFKVTDVKPITYITGTSYTLPPGSSITVDSGLIIDVTNGVDIAGTISASGKNGQSILIRAGTDVNISGTLSAGDGAMGKRGGEIGIISRTKSITITSSAVLTTGNGGSELDGGTLTLISADENISIAGHVASGNGGAGLSVTTANGSTLEGGNRGGGGGHGGHIILRAKAGSIAFAAVGGLIRIGNGGNGADAQVAGQDLLSYNVPATNTNGGGSSGGLLLDSPTLVGMTTTIITVPSDVPARNVLASAGSAVTFVTSNQVTGGVGGDAGAYLYGTDANGTSTWPPTARPVAMQAVGKDAADTVSPREVRGANGGDGWVNGSRGQSANVRGVDGTYPGGAGQSVTAWGGNGGWGSANYGSGGNATARGGNGGPGRNPSGEGGKGGNATAFGGSGRIGGTATARGGHGGDGGNGCITGNTGNGGNGGNGGDGAAFGGLRGGIDFSYGGDGGDGGNGAPYSGSGGAGGSPTGAYGNPGHLCPVPIQTSMIIGGGEDYSVFMNSSGAIVACGDNQYGSLGPNAPKQDNISTVVPGPSFATPPTKIAVGSYHTAADGQVYTWGSNYYGELGDGTTNDSATPIAVHGMSNAQAVAAGNTLTLAVLSDGTVWAWGGYSGWPALGNGSTNASTSPVQVSGLSNVIAVATARYFGVHSLALKSDGTVWAWGTNFYGQLGDGTNTDRLTPVRVSGLAGITAIVATANGSLALKNDGTVWAWGQLAAGATNSSPPISRNTPIQVTGLFNVTAIAAGTAHYVALKNDGTAWTWGTSWDANTYGQLGNGTTTNSNAAIPVSSLSGITQIGAGGYHSLARKNDGTVWAWGRNSSGQLGDGTTTNRTTPVPVSGLILN